MTFLARLRVEPLEGIDLGDDRRADLSRRGATSRTRATMG